MVHPGVHGQWLGYAGEYRRFTSKHRQSGGNHTGDTVAVADFEEETEIRDYEQLTLL